MTTYKSSRSILAAIGALVAVLLVVAVVLAVRPPPELDPATPEGAAQGYFQAVLDGDEDLAFGYLVEPLRDRCVTGELHYSTADQARVVITGVTTENGDAEVEVEITETYGDSPFDAGSYSFDETLVMNRHGDRWLIAETPWPLNCR